MGVDACGDLMRIKKSSALGDARDTRILSGGIRQSAVCSPRFSFAGAVGFRATALLTKFESLRARHFPNKTGGILQITIRWNELFVRSFVPTQDLQRGRVSDH